MIIVIIECNIHTNSQSYPQTINNWWITLCERIVFRFLDAYFNSNIYSSGEKSMYWIELKL